MKGNSTQFSLGVVTGLLLAGILALSRRQPADSEIERYRSVRDFVRTHYVREVDSTKLLDEALRGMVQSLDPYSRYYDRHQIAALERETTGRYRGIGVVFRSPASEGQVLFCLPDSPAARAGVRVGDRIESVNGRPLAELADGELHATLTTQEVRELRMVVRGLDGEFRELEMKRAALTDPTVRHARMLDGERGIGYVAITSFSLQTPQEFVTAVERLERQGLRALVIDVRSNLGGVLGSAVEIAGRFVSEGVLVSTEGRGDPVVYEAKRSEARWAGMPLVVLVDKDSASASEVFAAALQDHRAAVIVGSPTYGKGMVQKVHAFGGDEGEVKLTTAYYYTPAHRNLERTVEDAWEYGLLPDVSVDLTGEERRSVHQHLASYSPPAGALEELRAWEERSGLVLIEAHPPDAQLDAALDLFRGERPGPFAVGSNG